MSCRILIVDDNVHFNKILAMSLRNEGYEVYCVFEGLEAVSAAHRIHPDLIILDIMLPQMDGHRVCRFIKRDKTLANIPVVMVTSRDTDEDRQLSKEDGVDSFITKPTTADEILQTIRRFIR